MTTRAVDDTEEQEQGRQAEGKQGQTRRRTLAGLGGMAAGVVAAACGAGGGSGAGGTGAAQAGATKAPTALSGTILWQTRDQPEYADLSRWAIDEFTKRFPNVKVEASPNNVGSTEKTIAQMVSGSGPDVFQGWGRLQVQYAAKGATLNLADLVKQLPQAEVNDFVDAQWKGMVVPTTQFRYGMPTYVNMWVLYFNNGIFQERGVAAPTADWTHDTYADTLKRLTFRRSETQVWGGFANLTIPDRQYHIKAFGGHYVDPSNFGKAALDQEAAQKGMQWQYDRLFTDKTFAPIDSAKRTWAPNSQQDGFVQGVLATFEDGLDKLNAVGSKFTGTGWNVMHLPKGLAMRNALVTTDSWAIWKQTKVKDAAWELMKFITGKEFYDQQAKALAYIPSRKSQLDGWVSLMKGKGPGFAGVDYKVVTDALTGANGMTYLTVDEVFQCQKEAEDVLQPALNAVLSTGEKIPSYFRDIKAQLDAAAGGCGARYA
jgi:multiple sugar transport system substrate-binding protein